MSSAQYVSTEASAELLRANKFCLGRRRGKRYVCGGDADGESIGKVIDLVVEAVSRVLRQQPWSSWWINAWREEWLRARDNVENILRGKYGNDVVNALSALINEFISYLERLRKWWIENNVSGEVRQLINELMSGRGEVIIRNNGISVYGGHVMLNAHRTPTGSKIIKLMPRGLNGVRIEVPDVFSMTMYEGEYARFVNDVLPGLRAGFAATDEGVDKGRPAMSSTQVWQVLLWSLLYFGKAHMYIDAVNINEDNVTTTWRLRVLSHRPLKGMAFELARGFSENELLVFMFTAVLGDGSVFVNELRRRNGRVNDVPAMAITMSPREFERWRPVFDRLRNLGFRYGKPVMQKGAVIVKFSSGFAVDFAKAMINVLPPVMRDLLDALAFEKWVNLRLIANKELRHRKDEMQVNVAGMKFTVEVKRGTVRLVHYGDEGEAEAVREVLRGMYGDEFYVNVRKSGRYMVVAVPMRVFERYDNIRTKVIQVLCRKYEKTRDERRRQIIMKHLRKLAPTEEVATR